METSGGGDSSVWGVTQEKYTSRAETCPQIEVGSSSDETSPCDKHTPTCQSTFTPLALFLYSYVPNNSDSVCGLTLCLKFV